MSPKWRQVSFLSPVPLKVSSSCPLSEFSCQCCHRLAHIYILHTFLDGFKITGFHMLMWSWFVTMFVVKSLILTSWFEFKWIHITILNIYTINALCSNKHTGNMFILNFLQFLWHLLWQILGIQYSKRSVRSYEFLRSVFIYKDKQKDVTLCTINNYTLNYLRIHLQSNLLY